MKDTLKKFKPTASVPEHGVAMMFDLEGFSKFFAQPDVHLYVPKYINHIIEAISVMIHGGKHEWLVDENDKKSEFEPLPNPIHWKFLGDGLLVLWRYNDFNKEQLGYLMNRCWNLMINFEEFNSFTSEDVPVMDIPQKIRFGISAGTIYKLTYESTKSDEYIGYCINLASRLQSYCRELGYIVSGRLHPSNKDIQNHKYLKVVAKNIKGFPNEIVIVDKESFEELDETIRNTLFQEI